MSRQRFEGPDLEAVLDDLRRTLGADARIVEANKVRSGGIGGFFSRERFEVFAEPVAPGPEPVAPSAVPVPAPEPVVLTPEPAAPVAASVPVAELEPEAEPAAADPVSPPQDLLELADLVSAVEARRHAPAPPAAPTFAAAFARARLEVEDVLTAEPVTAPTSTLTADRPVEIAVEAPYETPYAAPVGSGPSEPHEPGRWPPAPPRPPVEVAAPDPGPAIPAAEAPLHRLGLPPELIPAVIAGRDLRADLVERLATLPSAPPVPVTAGAVLLLVGPEGPTRAAARRHALAAGLTADDVVVVSPDETGLPPWLVVGSPADARDRRRTWWRRAHPTFVALDARPGLDDAWTEAMVTALEPTLVFGVAAAASKPDDLAAWAGRFAFDALELVGLHETVSPASALASGIPVASLDGAPADAATWTDILLTRIAP